MAVSHWLIWAVVIVVLLVIRSYFKKKKQKFEAALNIQLAALTFYDQDMDTQDKIVANARLIIETQSNTQFAEKIMSGTNVPEIMSFYALAMMEMGIKPYVQSCRWAVVRNPFAAVINIKPALVAARQYLEARGVQYDHWVTG